MVVKALKQERLVPILSLDVRVPTKPGEGADGEPAKLLMFQGDSEEEVLAEFASRHGLNPKQTESLRGQVGPLGQTARKRAPR